jgi:fucose 4-O-acetylase-like acetyltransferase
MTTEKSSSEVRSRLHWLDNLRTIIIFLVVLYHVGGVYEGAGMWGWFWIVDDPDTISWVGIVGIAFDVFIMPTMFFISGYLTPSSSKNRSGWTFLKGKFKRLMIPWAIAVFTLIPLYKVIFLFSRGLPQENWTTYFHFTNPNSQNWLWFLPLLFSFNILYWLLSKLNINWEKISFAWMLVGGLVVSFVYTYFIGEWLGFRSWTLTPIIDFENERLLLYFLSFVLGVMSFSKNVFTDKSKRKVLYIVASSVAWLPVTAHIFARLWPFFYPNPAEFEVTTVYRLLWHLSFYLSALTMAYLMIESFWRYLDKSGKLWSELNRNSYGVYIIHVIMIGVFGTLFMYTSLPALAKYPLLVLSAYISSNLLVSGYRYIKTSLKSSPQSVPSKAADAAQ